MGSSALADFGGGDVRSLCFLMYVPRSKGDAASERVHLFIYLLLQQRYYRPNAKFITTETKKIPSSSVLLLVRTYVRTGRVSTACA